MSLIELEISIDDQDQRDANQHNAEIAIQGGVHRDDIDSIYENAAECIDLRQLPQRHWCIVDRKNSHHVRFMQSNHAQRCVQSDERCSFGHRIRYAF